jgi:Farnesoic acid 0-methyl transferase
LHYFVGNTFALKTPDKQLDDDRWLTFKSSRRSLNFEVRACYHARLRFSQIPFATPQYEIVLGSDFNSKSKILRYDGDDVAVVAEEDTPGVVDCSESRKFGVSWNNGKITVSRGSVSGQVVLDWLADHNSINLFAIGLSTGPQSDGDWKFSYSEGIHMYI